MAFRLDAQYRGLDDRDNELAWHDDDLSALVNAPEALADASEGTAAGWCKRIGSSRRSPSETRRRGIARPHRHASDTRARRFAFITRSLPHMSSHPAGFRLELALHGPRVVVRGHDGTEAILAEFPRSGKPHLDSLRPVLARECLVALSTGLHAGPGPAEGNRAPLEILGLALAACDEADTAFAVLNTSDGLTRQARRQLGSAWTMVQEAIGAARGPDSAVARAARENLARLRGLIAAEALDRFRAALTHGKTHDTARAEAIAAAVAGSAWWATPGHGESVWDLARECVDAWPEDPDVPVNGADLTDWFAGIRLRFQRALQLTP